MVIKNRTIVLFLAAVLILSVGAALYLYVTSSTISYRGIDVAQKSSGLTIILPTQLPNKLTITDHPSYDKVTHTVTTRIQIDGYGVTLSQQKRPDTDLKQIDAEDTFLVNVGAVYILKGEEGRLQAIVETSDSWVIVNADTKLGVKTFKVMLESLDAI